MNKDVKPESGTELDSLRESDTLSHDDTVTLLAPVVPGEEQATRLVYPDPMFPNPEEEARRKEEAERGEAAMRKVTGEVDVHEYLKAMAIFLSEQTRFLVMPYKVHANPEYAGALERYSVEQSRFIEAQLKLLRQIGII